MDNWEVLHMNQSCSECEGVPMTQVIPPTTPGTVFVKKLDLIRASVLEQLGTPADLWRVTINDLQFNRYRVNVWRSLEVPGALYPKHRIMDSFYVVTDFDGHLVGGNKIEKKY